MKPNQVNSAWLYNTYDWPCRNQPDRVYMSVFIWHPGLFHGFINAVNIQDPASIWGCCLTSIGNTTCVDQTILSSSYLYNGISYTGKKTSLNWIRTQFFAILTRPSRSQYNAKLHYSDVIMSAMAYQITSLTIVYSTVYSGADHRRRRKHQSSESLAFVQGIHRWPVNSPHKRSVTRKCFHLMTSSWHQIKFIYLAMMTTVGATSISPFVRIDTLFAYWSVHQLESSGSRCALWVHYQHYTTQ